MNGGVIVESNSSVHAPALKQELLTEHYAISAKRPSQKDKMNRQLKVNTAFPPDQQQHPSFTGPLTHPLTHPPPFSPYPPPPNGPGPGPGPGPGYYGPPPPGGYYPYPPPGHPGGPPMNAGPPLSAGPVPGPSRRHSQPFVHGPPLQPMHPGHGLPQFPPQWDNMSQASSASSHKRKRSDSSVGRAENAASRRGSMADIQEADENRYRSGPGRLLPTPPSSGPPTEDARPAKRGVYVTATQEEGRKLGLVHNSIGTEAKEATPTRGPPRVKSTTTLSVSASGKAGVGSSEVLQSELELLERSNQGTPAPALPQTPNRGDPHTPTSAPPASGPGPDANDTPGTKATKVSRRLSAFNLSSRPSEPMYSIRLDMGQGQPCRVALRKELALAFVGLDKATTVVEESRNEDEPGWAVMNGAPGSRPPVRPDWPDEEAPWKIGSGVRRARQLREEKERVAMLKRYLETSSDDEDEDGAGRFPKPRAQDARFPADANATSDAKAALLSALNRSRRPPVRRSAPPVFLPNGVVSCVCKNTTTGGSLIPCSSCRSWHHVACVGQDALQAGDNWVCDPCVVQARRATLSSPTGRTPSSSRYTHERSHSAFRGGDMALALAPSPMFAGDSGMVQATPMPMGSRTPYSPTRNRHRARVLSYGTDLWAGGEDSPTTPVPPPRIPDHFSTPRPDDSVFDVNSTPSRHLNTDPRMAGQFNSLFAVTPLMGRSRNASGMLAADTPMPGPGRRNVSGGQMPHSDSGVVGRHEFLQGLTADRRAPATEAPRSPPMLNREDPVSPSPFASANMGPRNKFSHMRGGGGSRGSIGLGMPMRPTPDEE